MLICFGGDGTILHASKIATAHNLPILGINIGTMGFIAELEAGELELFCAGSLRATIPSSRAA